jgi:hypothetical protein
MSNKVLELDAFIRKIGINKTTLYSIFLGAGTSISSGVPSAESCIWEWKRSIFLSKNPGLEQQFSELTLESVRQKIQKWLDNQNQFPKLGVAEEYNFYIKCCYQTNDDRRKYFQEKVIGSRPHIGYNLLCLLAEAGLIQTVYTTNFDGLTMRAASNFELTPLEISIDSQQRANRTLAKGELLCISLHGDYRYDELKNTLAEVRNQEKILSNHLVENAKDRSLIVCGYSGRDKSIMENLEKAYSQEGAGILYWCGYGDQIPASVERLLNVAEENNRTAFFIPTNGFDDLMKRLSLYCLSNNKAERAREIISQSESKLFAERVPFQISDNLPIQTIIKSNAFYIECPNDMFQFSLKELPQNAIWKWPEDKSRGNNFVAVPHKGKILAIGDIDSAKVVFGAQIYGPVERVPIEQQELAYEDGAINALFRQALIYVISEEINLSTDYKEQVWKRNIKQQYSDQDNTYNIFESAVLFLRNLGGKTHLIIKPSLRVESKNGDELTVETKNKIKNALLGYQHNKEFNQAVNDWRQSILGNKDPIKEFHFGNGKNSHFVFKIQRSPVFASVRSQINKTALNIAQRIQSYIKQNGIQLSEPKPAFSNKQGNNFVLDEHPLRGLLANRPYDYPITQSGLISNVTIGVICPKPESGILLSYLNKAQLRQSPSETEKDYLLDYPGFTSVFGLPLEIPRPGDSGWITCPEPKEADNQKASLELGRILIQAINNLKASLKPSVVLIFIPDRWKGFRNYETENEKFDLHDYIKAYCAQNGIASQFLEQETISNTYQCRIWWWLSLAIYTKAMRTPWVLESLDLDTAFIGIGFGINSKAKKGEHVVLGCSHLYNPRGEGLQFRLSPIENPTIVQGNAFMSREDARNVGETIRTLFFESSNKLPNRVVIHKQTAFRREERNGLEDGLSGVNEIDLIEINFDSALRYVASLQKMDGTFDEDSFPVKRGSTIQIDEYSALTWVHGVTESVKKRWKYYKGKRRIPTPLILRRHSGNSDLVQIATEILALSKMDWNSADMYSKLPVTIQSSQKVAKIGSLLHRFGPTSFDYRLFI